MKKLLIISAAFAAMLLSASCQKESNLDPAEDTVTATFTVTAPAVFATKAIGDGLSADNLVFAVFDKDGQELEVLRQGDWKNKIGEDNTVLKFDNSEKPTATVKVTLVRGKEYSFVCWAQNEAATCYDFKDMKQIKVSYTDYNAANNDLRDAFYAYAKTEGVVTDNFNQSITLRRPFAQINVGTTDFEDAQKGGLAIDNLYTKMTVKNAATVLETFTGKGNTPVEVNYAYAHTLAPAYDLVINKDKVEGYTGVIEDKYGWLGMNYILVAGDSENGTDSDLVEVFFEVSEGEGEKAVKLTSYNVSSVPVKRGYRTNLVGDLLTAQGEISIIVDPIFDKEYIKDVI